MKDELLKTIEYLVAYGDGLKAGVDKFVRAVPIYTQQQIRAEAKKRLNSTAEHYVSHTKVKLEENVLLVQLDRDDWLVKALESGIGAFGMKEKTLNSPKARISKAGYRYMTIPIGKQKGGQSGTEKGQEFQKRINEVLQSPKFGLRRLKTLMNGQIVESQQVLTDDPVLKGFYRTRMFEDSSTYHSNKKSAKWQYVLFRTMSENPASLSQWEHPGIKPAHILRAVERWLDQSLEPLLESFIEAEIKAVNERMKTGV